MSPVPLAGQLEGAVATHVQLAPVNVAGNVAVTVAPATISAPGLETTIV